MTQSRWLSTNGSTRAFSRSPDHHAQRLHVGAGARPTADGARRQLLVAGLAAWSILVMIHLRAVRSRVGPSPGALAGRIFVVQVAVLPLLIAGLSLLLGAGGEPGLAQSEISRSELTAGRTPPSRRQSFC
jgi:hypothetical protein